MIRYPATRDELSMKVTPLDCLKVLVCNLSWLKMVKDAPQSRHCRLGNQDLPAFARIARDLIGFIENVQKPVRMKEDAWWRRPRVEEVSIKGKKDFSIPACSSYFARVNHG